jgi:hypothetical protein
MFGIGVVLHLMQPLARLCGRFKYGLHPWRHRGASAPIMLRAKTLSVWSEAWRMPEAWLRQVQTKLRSEGTVGVPGGGYDDWDLEVQGGLLATVRMRMAVEEHGAGRQLLRFRIWPRCSLSGFSILLFIAGISAAAAAGHSWPAAALLFGITVVLGARMLRECALAMHKLTNVLEDLRTNLGKETEDQSNATTVTLTAVARNS